MKAQDQHTTSVEVTTRTPSGAEATVRVFLDSVTPTAAQLIRAKISAEWSCGGPVGIESISLDLPRTVWPSLDDAVRNALDAYRAGWYVIQVDGDQPGGLDIPIGLHAASQVLFIRLYPLEEA